VLLFTLCRLALIAGAGPRLRWPGALAAVACILYAASDEWHQTFVPGRGGTVSDVCIDTTGIMLAWLAWSVRDRRRTAIQPNVLDAG